MQDLVYLEAQFLSIVWSKTLHWLQRDTYHECRIGTHLKAVICWLIKVLFLFVLGVPWFPDYVFISKTFCKHRLKIFDQRAPSNGIVWRILWSVRRKWLRHFEAVYWFCERIERRPHPSKRPNAWKTYAHNQTAILCRRFFWRYVDNKYLSNNDSKKILFLKKNMGMAAVFVCITMFSSVDIMGLVEWVSS